MVCKSDCLQWITTHRKKLLTELNPQLKIKKIYNNKYVFKSVLLGLSKKIDGYLNLVTAIGINFVWRMTQMNFWPLLYLTLDFLSFFHIRCTYQKKIC